jgi:hypothetical protein
MRTSTTRRRSRLGLLIATALVVAGCTAASDAPATAPVPAPSPSPAPVPAPSPEPEPSPDVVSSTRTVFLVRSGPADLYVEPSQFDDGQVAADLADEVRLAVTGLLTLTGSQLERLNLTVLPDLFSSVPSGTTLNSVSVTDGVVTIDLGGAFATSSGSSSQERTFAQQLAHTVLLDPTLTAVVLLVDGASITELWGHLDWSEPLTADPFALSPVTIEEPLAATTSLTRTLTVRGQATVFEATVLVRLEDGSGEVVLEDFVTATEGGPGRGSWEWELTVPDAGTWTIVAGASDPSGGEGPPPFETRRTIVVTD